MLRKFRRNSKRDSKADVCFVHVAKTAGSSLNRALKTAFTRSVGFDVHHYYDALKAISAEQEHKLRDPETRMLILQYLLNQRTPLIYGHFLINSRLIERNPQRSFITVLREPLERLQSQILYDWSHARIEFESDQLENQVIEFLDSSRGYRISNLYTWTFGGFDCLEEDIEEAREQATICLEKFAIVGTQSRMEELEMRINQLTGLQINVGTTNVTKAKREEDEASFHELKNLLQKDSIKDRMAHMTSGDQRIYDKFCNS